MVRQLSFLPLSADEDGDQLDLIEAVAEICEWCGAAVEGPCADTCDCPTCENGRALDESYDAWADRVQE